MEYLNVLDTEESRLVAENTYDMHEFLFDILQRGELLDLAPVHMDALVHLHCHHLVQGIEGKVLGLLRSIPDLNIKTIEKGCCGVGGSFSFIKGNLQKSLKMGEELFGEVRATSLPIFSTGESCALQMEQGSGRTIGLTVDLLADACGLHLSG
jgi:Fe-S oxidoreductase